jgi:predicted lipid-binding transport protein (Tim44 family)
MLRTIFTIGLFALIGLFLLKLAFGIFGVLFAILIGLLFVALKIAVVGFVIYLLIRIFSPDTARRLRQKWSGSRGL